MNGSSYTRVATPFLTERARARAPQILSFASITGAAALVSASGEVVMFSGTAVEANVTRIGRVAAARTRRGAEGELLSFKDDTGACVHAIGVGWGWTLCVLSTMPVATPDVLDRVRRAAHVLTLALKDGSGSNTPGNSGGSHGAAQVTARPVKARR